MQVDGFDAHLDMSVYTRAGRIVRAMDTRLLLRVFRRRRHGARRAGRAWRCSSPTTSIRGKSRLTKPIGDAGTQHADVARLALADLPPTRLSISPGPRFLARTFRSRADPGLGRERANARHGPAPFGASGDSMRASVPTAARPSDRAGKCHGGPDVTRRQRFCRHRLGAARTLDTTSARCNRCGAFCAAVATARVFSRLPCKDLQIPKWLLRQRGPSQHGSALRCASRTRA